MLRDFMYNRTPHNGLYRPEFEHDSCGFGLIAQMDGVVSHSLVQSAIDSLARLTHRGAIAADGKTGDGCGLLIRKPDGFLRAVAAESDIKLEELYAAGVRRINVSLDTLDPAKFTAITRWGKLEKVMEGLEAAKRAGLKVKINAVPHTARIAQKRRRI